MKTFKDLNVGDKICIVNFDPEREINSIHKAEVIGLEKIKGFSINAISITCRYHKNEVDTYAVYGDTSSTDWIEDTERLFVSKEEAIDTIRSWVEAEKHNLHETNKLLAKQRVLL